MQPGSLRTWMSGATHPLPRLGVPQVQLVMPRVVVGVGVGVGVWRVVLLLPPLPLPLLLLLLLLLQGLLQAQQRSET